MNIVFGTPELVLILGSLIALVLCALLIFIFYLIIKAAVKNAIRDSGLIALLETLRHYHETTQRP